MIGSRYFVRLSCFLVSLALILAGYSLILISLYGVEIINCFVLLSQSSILGGFCACSTRSSTFCRILCGCIGSLCLLLYLNEVLVCYVFDVLLKVCHRYVHGFLLTSLFIPIPSRQRFNVLVIVDGSQLRYLFLALAFYLLQHQRSKLFRQCTKRCQIHIIPPFLC